MQFLSCIGACASRVALSVLRLGLWGLPGCAWARCCGNHLTPYPEFLSGIPWVRRRSLLQRPPTLVPNPSVDVLGAQAGSLLRRPHAAQASREYVRGSLGSLPFAPGATLVAGC